MKNSKNLVKYLINKIVIRGKNEKNNKKTKNIEKCKI
jgi:hypothetical protein